MSEEEKAGTEVQRPVLTVIQGNFGKTETPVLEAGSPGFAEVIDDSIDELRNFMEEVANSLEGTINSPIASVCMVMVHEDGGVSHGHSCSEPDLLALIGALHLKAGRLESSYRKGQ